VSDGGKGSKPRPFSIDKKIFDNNWDIIFYRKKTTDDYQDILSTEDCILDAFDNLEKEEKK
jgi:hypothetical protein